MQTGVGLNIKGELSATEDITIGGTFEGTIDLPKHRLVAAEGSRVNASVTALAVTIDGRLEGHITADSVDIGPKAMVDASLITGKLALEEGATFNGAVNTERARAAANIAKHRIAGAAAPAKEVTGVR
jgi:cytoskeletal protein CcmA (bactofilin family)